MAGLCGCSDWNEWVARKTHVEDDTETAGAIGLEHNGSGIPIYATPGS